MGLESSGFQPSTGLQKLWLLLGGYVELCPSLLVTRGVRPIRTRAGLLAMLSPMPPPGKEVRSQGGEVTVINGTDGKASPRRPHLRKTLGVAEWALWSPWTE